MKASSDATTAGTKAYADAQKVAKETELKAAQMALQDAQERARLTMEWHKAALASSTTLTVEQMRHMGMDDVADKRIAGEQEAASKSDHERSEREELRQTIGMMAAMMQELTESSRAPKSIERDASGRAISIGGMAIRRNADDLIEGIG